MIARKRFLIASSVILSQSAGGAVVEAERVVDSADEAKSTARDRDDLAIARVPHAIDHVLSLVDRLRAGRGEGGDDDRGGRRGADEAAQRAGPDYFVYHERFPLPTAASVRRGRIVACRMG
jgi:hypothetical protein